VEEHRRRKERRKDTRRMNATYDVMMYSAEPERMSRGDKARRRTGKEQKQWRTEALQHAIAVVDVEQGTYQKRETAKRQSIFFLSDDIVIGGA
jgi:hypothetical protein